MCFDIQFNSKENSRVLIATKNIKCFKLLTKTRILLYSPFQKVKYGNNKADKIHKNSDITINTLNRRIYKGLHSYSTITKARRVLSFYYGEALIIYPTIDCTRQVCIFEAIIPRGAVYMYNSRTREYVSTQLIVYPQKDVTTKIKK